LAKKVRLGGGGGGEEKEEEAGQMEGREKITENVTTEETDFCFTGNRYSFLLGSTVWNMEVIDF
jgi:hypothetical protein